MNILPLTNGGHKHGSRWHPETCIDSSQVEYLWKSGLSTRQIASKLGYSSSYVHVVCRRLGLVRSQSDAAIIRQPAKSKHWRTSRQNARKKMERLLDRRLESWEHVHHKDGDHTNNDLSNLQILVDQEHYDLHWPNRLNGRYHEQPS